MTHTTMTSYNYFALENIELVLNQVKMGLTARELKVTPAPSYTEGLTITPDLVDMVLNVANKLCMDARVQWSDREYGIGVLMIFRQRADAPDNAKQLTYNYMAKPF